MASNRRFNRWLKKKEEKAHEGEGEENIKAWERTWAQIKQEAESFFWGASREEKA